MIRERWNQLAAREQRLVGFALVLVGLAVVWWMLLAPALAVLKAAPARHAKLDADLQAMQRLRAQVQGIQSQAPLPAGEARRQLESSVQQVLGSGASIQVAGDRATVTLRGVSAEAVPTWIAQARANARSQPLEMRLSRSAQGLWDGSIVMGLPPS
jgi:general secretion pathway protein M